MPMFEFLKDPLIAQYIVAGISVLASIVVVISALTIRKSRKNIEKATKLLGEASMHLENTFDSMLKAIIGIAELRKLYPQEGDVYVQAGREKRKIIKPPPKKTRKTKTKKAVPTKEESTDTPLVDAVIAGKNPFIDPNKTIDLTDEVEMEDVIELTDEVKGGNKK